VLKFHTTGGLSVKKVLFALLFLSFSLSNLFGWKLEDIKDNRLTLHQTQDMIRDLIIRDRLNDLKKWQRLYPDSFLLIDMAEAYYLAGQSLYNANHQMLALKAYIRGFVIFGHSRYKRLCGFYAAKILYQNYERESALYYVNRVIRTSPPGDKWLAKAKRLKRRIQWEYISRNEGIPDNSISDIAFDGNDVWIGMWTGGVGRFTRSTYSLTLFKKRENGLISPHVRDIAIVGRRVWVGTYNGLCYYDKKLSQWHRVQNRLDHTRIKRVVPFGHKLYVATLGEGLYVLDMKTDTWRQIFNKSKYISDVLLVGRTLYIATLDQGLFSLKNKKTDHIIKKVPVKTLAYLHDRVWAGSYGQGILIVSTRTGKHFKNITRKNGLSSDYIEALYPLPKKGLMLIGTLGGGADFYHEKTHQITHISDLDGLPSDDVVRITVAHNHIWFGTLSGGIGIFLTDDFKNL